MSYLAFYRTFRPLTFDTVVRQEHVVKILKNQITTGKIGHAYLFCGPRGTGKTTLAKIFARAINCETPVNGSPCGKCPTCLALANGGNLDISEIDAASNNGVDEMRDLREKVQYPPVAGKYKVYIIDEVHMLTASAFNAVLKTLEEPPRHAVFILATTEPQKIPATILSRCMRFDFKLIPQSDLVSLVKSVYDKTGKEYEEAAVVEIARAGAGSARDSLSIADTCASYSQGKLTYADVNAILGNADFSSVAKIVGDVFSEDTGATLTSIEEVLSTGKSVGVLIKDILNFLNGCAIAKTCKNAKSILNLPDETFASLYSVAEKADGHKILRATEIFAKCESDLRYALNGRIILETAAIKCAQPQNDYNLDALIGKIHTLEKSIENGVKLSVENLPQKNTPEYGVTKGETSGIITSSEKPKVVIEDTKPAQKVADKIKTEKVIKESPFDFPPPPPLEEPPIEIQPTLWENVPAAKPATISESDKKSVFGKFIRALRSTRKNAVVFTLCMDLSSFFEGDKLVLTTDSEAVFKGLTRPDHNKFIGETLTELGVTDFDVRLLTAGENEAEAAESQLKKNFDGIDIEIK